MQSGTAVWACLLHVAAVSDHHRVGFLQDEATYTAEQTKEHLAPVYKSVQEVPLEADRQVIVRRRSCWLSLLQTALLPWRLTSLPWQLHFVL